MTTNKILLRASGVKAFKSCPSKFRLGTILELVPDQDTESQRVGTNWHKLHETYREACRSNDPAISGSATPVCDPVSVVMQKLASMYENVPTGFDAKAWEIERTVLAVSFMAHCWCHQGSNIETLATELRFVIPLYHPKTGMPLRRDEVECSGTIDWVTRQGNRIGFIDYKSTTRSIDTDSDFWNHLRLDTQISMYTSALHYLHILDTYGVSSIPGANADDVVMGAIYDVWHRPTIKPSMLTQKETAALLDESGKHEYCGAVFATRVEPGEGDAVRVFIDDVETEVEMGKKGYAIRESPGMYGARLMQDIQARPHYYFVRREIARTQQDIVQFRGQLYSTYQAIKTARDTGHWIQNEHSCDSMFKCPFTKICYNNIDVSNGQIPEGFRKGTTELTISGNPVEI